ncbi:hypothetical protein [Paenibacillus sp. UNC451MF]|uniref:hypothetical protein n=1 Tax=Paenibacillus sp. UNC451MF TaxID=1449063 RepID=UPI0004900BD9|nr:hypothetical protein [Paenibacillus sp. UNC451MF]
MREKQISKESSVYHYRLLQRIRYKQAFIIAFWCLPGIAYVWDLIRWHPLPMLLSVVLIPLLHTLIIYLYFTFKEKRPLHQWGIQYRFPWIGFVPLGYFALYRMLNLNLHLLWVTAVICGCFFPWVSFDMILHAMFIHLWILLPRFILIFLMRHCMEDGYLKINEQDTSCYAQ